MLPTILTLVFASCCHYGALASLRRVRAADGTRESAAELLGGRREASSAASHRDGLRRSVLRVGAEQSLAHAMGSMTLARAVEVVGRRAGLPQGLRSFLQKLGEHGSTSMELRNSLHAGGYDVTAAKAALNRLAEEARRKLDLEQVQCSEYQLRQEATMEEARGEQDEYAAQAASAKAHILGAEATIHRASGGRARLIDGLARHNRKCALDSSVSKEQLEEAKGDVEMMERVLARMNCSQGQPTFVQCREGTLGSSLLASQRALGPALAGVRPSLKRALRRSLLQAVARSRPAPPAAAAGPGSLDSRGGVAVANTSDLATSRRKQRAKCTSHNQPTCALMTDELLMLQTAIMDKVDEMNAELATLQGRCKATEDNFNAQLSELEFRAREAQTSLAESMATQAQTEEQSRLKSLQVRDLARVRTEAALRCRDDLEAFEHEVCGLRTIRSELHAMSGDRAFIQDCEVSEWTSEECTVSCGGGMQKLKRDVVTIPTQGGTSCPPLEMMRRCSEQACPVDCSVGDWSRWSSCTARCGGGVRQRARDVVREPRHGGAPCGQTTEAEGCNMHACDRDCELLDWSDWSACSRMCNGGLTERRRTVRQPALGEGLCPEPDGKERLERHGCNKDACEVPPGQPTLRCNSTLDVVVLLQGSASLQEAGWAAMKRAGELLVRAFAGGSSRVGVVLFSGPRGAKTFLSCSRGVQPGEPLPDMAKDCSIRWVSHLTSDVEGVAEKVRGLSFPRGTTLTSAALATTIAELRTGRQDARSVVVVLTNGRPMSPRLTGQAAGLVRERARLLWVPVTRYAPLREIRQWASAPVMENVIQIPSFAELANPQATNEIISHVCPEVK